MAGKWEELARELLAQLPKDQPPRGRTPDWGGLRENAFAIAAALGHSFDPKCQSCDVDVYDVLRSIVK